MAQIIGHRGASGIAPENTMKAFERAIEEGADGIEFDVRQCKSGELVVMHDETVDRTTDGEGEVSTLSWDDLQELDAGEGEHIPLLEEVLETFCEKTRCLIELKEDVAEAAVPLIEKYCDLDQCVVLSFDADVLKAVRGENAEIKTGLIAGGFSEKVLRLCHAIDVDMLAIRDEKASEENLEQVKKHGFEVNVWTINEEERAEELAEWSADVIVTDRPDLLS